MKLSLNKLCTAIAAAVLISSLPASAATIRGYGNVVPTATAISGVTAREFQCDSPAHAIRLRQKLGRDLQQSATVSATWSTVNVAGIPFAVLTRPGLGNFLIASKADIVYVLIAPTLDGFAPASPTLIGSAGYDPAAADYVFLDKFDHTGIGSWYPSYWGDSFTKGHINTVDDHFAFARSQGLTIQPNDGGALLENLIPKLHEYNRPYHFAQWQDWSQSLARLCPDDLFMPSTVYTHAPNYYGQVSFGSQKLEQYRNWEYQQMMPKRVNDPLLVDWLDPNGEVDAAAWLIAWDASDNNRRNFVKYLRDIRGYTPSTLSSAWYGKAGQVKSWADIKLPLNYDFLGVKPGDIVAASTWHVHTGTLDDGLKLGYQTPTCADTKWPTFQMPGGELPAIEWRSAKPTWYRGSVNVSAQWLADRKKLGPIYLTVASFASTRGWKNPDRVWVNGQEAGSISAQPGAPINGQLEVTPLLHAGANSIVYVPANTDSGITGIFFLTSTPHQEFPFNDSLMNARYYDWVEYQAWAPLARVEATLKMLRGTDPERPIKVHAAENKDLFEPMIVKYGAYPHNTGEGGFLRAWDKRLGYVWGAPASAEFGGPFELPTEAERLKRWFGYFTFEGLNAFDQFHNIQDMMYHPVLDQLWLKYMPYLHLANRWDLRKPDVAIMWSSKNNRYLDRSLAYAFDLGRGDLQSIGYSYIYIDEASLAAGLAKGYPVLFDTGTTLMSPTTVAQITDYVKNGGTFIATQDTGRHTYTKRDAWPISSLTGFHVREIRRMTGIVSILKDQPLFSKLAGQSFYNTGRSTDYSDYNFADKCLVLDPASPDTKVIARYQDGTVAIGMRQVGKGRVIVLGSPYWRDSFDKDGYWHPGEGQSAFLEDLLHGVGQEPLSASTNHAVWRERYFADNGTEEYIVLWNQSDQPQTSTFTWKTDRPATTLYDPKYGTPHTATVAGDTVTLSNLTLQANETLILATQPKRDAGDVVDAWFDHLSLWWRPSAPGAKVERPDLPIDEVHPDSVAGRVVTAAGLPALDMAALSSPGGDDGKWDTRLGFIKPENLNMNAAPTDRVVNRTVIQTPKTWTAADQYRIEFLPTYATGYQTLIVYLNGVRLEDAKLSNRAITRVDATGHVLFGQPNVVVVVAPADGYLGTVAIERQPTPSETIVVAGKVQLQATEDGGLVDASVPGKIKGLYAVKNDIVVPASWRGSRVFVRIKPTDIGHYDSFAINRKLIFTPVSWHTPVTYMDVTPWVKFGQANSLLLLTHEGGRTWSPDTLGIDGITIERVTRR